MTRILLLFLVSVAILSICAGIVYGGNLEMGKRTKPRVVFIDQKGNEMSLDDLGDFTGSIRYEIRWGHEPDARAVELHEEGRQQGTVGNHDEALRLFEQAIQIDPLWPYPVYDSAYTFLLKGDPHNAEACYAKVDSIAPEGFFTTKAALDCLRRERESIISPGMYLDTVRLEFVADERIKRQVCESMLEQCPAFPVAWNIYAGMLSNTDEVLAAVDSGLSYEPDLDTRGSLLLKKGLSLVENGDVKAGMAIIRQLADSSEETLNNKALAEMVLRSFETEGD